MNIVDVFVLLIAAIFVIIFYKQGLIAVLKSFISFIIATTITILVLNKALNIIANLGWKENVYTPLILFPFLIIIFWGVLVSFVVMIPTYWQGRISSALSIPISILYGLCVAIVLNLVLPQMISLGAISQSDNSLFSRELEKIYAYNYLNEKFLSTIDRELAKSIIVPDENKETIFIKLPNEISSISASSANQILLLTNKSRRDKGLVELKEEKSLDALALNYANEIISSKRFSHIDSAGKNPYERALSLGLKYNYVGENLAIAPTVESAHRALLASDAHRANIESPIFKNVGIAALDLGGNGILIVEEFGN